jgi:glycogen debranching enzyme
MRLPSISFDRAGLSNFENSIRKEWLITNGLGGYASSTVLGINTRKYHGLLIGAVHPPRDRRVFLSKLDEEIVLGDDAYQLGANEFQSGILPRGFDFLREREVVPYSVKSSIPDFTFDTLNLALEVKLCNKQQREKEKNVKSRNNRRPHRSSGRRNGRSYLSGHIGYA